MTLYQGPERRSHRVFVTANSEYHLSGSRCIGVRSKDGEWDSSHIALGAKLEGSIGFDEAKGYSVIQDEDPAPGHRMCFGDLLTSPLTRICRASKNDFEAYLAA